MFFSPNILLNAMKFVDIQCIRQKKLSYGYCVVLQEEGLRNIQIHLNLNLHQAPSLLECQGRKVRTTQGIAPPEKWDPDIRVQKVSQKAIPLEGVTDLSSRLFGVRVKTRCKRPRCW